MSRLTNPEALAHLEKRMVDTFGVGHHEYDAGTMMRPVPTAHLNAAIRITNQSGIVDKLSLWDGERRKSPAGKKAIIPPRALVVLYLLNTLMEVGVTYKSLARTLAYGFTPAHFAALGIETPTGDLHHWYKRVSDTTYRLIALMNPRPTPLRKILDDDQFEKLQQRMSLPSARELAERNQDRLDTFCNLLVEASVRQLPQDLWARYRGNIAIDATKVTIRGRRNSASDVGSRSNPDPLAGRYRREGSHGGIGASTDEAAYELETAAMVWNKPGNNAEFPSLITAISCHNPGAHVGHAAGLTARHKGLEFNRFTVIVDRAYNGERIETFHQPMAQLGVDLVFDYKIGDLGVQSNFEGLVLVDGSWYVGWMPTGLIEVSKELATVEKIRNEADSVIHKAKHPRKKKSQETTLSAEDLAAERSAAKVLVDTAAALPGLQQRLDMREPYRMIPKGRRDKDGYQRFTYPPLNKMLVQPPSPPAVTSITIPPVLPINEEVAAGQQSGRKPRDDRSKNDRSKSQPIKFGQTYPHKGADWRGYFGMRSHVEASNNLLKSPEHGDIDNKRKRSGRGYAATYFALAFAVVASNLRRISTFFVSEATRIQLASKAHRARRRKDELGKPLLKPELAPPPGNLA